MRNPAAGANGDGADLDDNTGSRYARGKRIRGYLDTTDTRPDQTTDTPTRRASYLKRICDMHTFPSVAALIAALNSPWRPPSTGVPVIDVAVAAAFDLGFSEHAPGGCPGGKHPGIAFEGDADLALHYAYAAGRKAAIGDDEAHAPYGHMHRHLRAWCQRVERHGTFSREG